MFMVEMNSSKVDITRFVIAFILSILLLALGYFLENTKIRSDDLVFEKETGYYFARVIDANMPDKRQARVMFLDFDSHSIEYKNKSNISPSYTSLYPVFGAMKDGEIKDVGVIGGGAYTMSNKLAQFYNDVNVTVIEIDPEVSRIAKKYFTVDDKKIKTVNKDARVYFNSTENSYDMIFGDAYNSFISLPWHLTTLEFTQLINKKLRAGGIYSVNFISSVSGEGSLFFKTMLKTFSSVFTEYYIFAFGENPQSTQNIVLVGIKGNKEKVSYKDMKQKLSSSKDVTHLARFLIDADGIDLSNAIVLKDDFAPIERLMMPTINQYFKSYNNFYNSIFD